MGFFNSNSLFSFGGLGLLMLLLIVWSVVWKALALWRSARAGSKPWFVVFLLVNTAGILEIIYLFALSKPSAPAVPTAPETKA